MWLCVIAESFLATPALAHDMTLEVRWSAEFLEGQLSYSDGSAAEGNYLQIEAANEPSMTTLALQTDAAGQFRVPLRRGIDYLITAEGEEGHRIRVRSGGAASNPDGSRSDSPTDGGWTPPIYLVLGALLLLSIPVARGLRPRPASESQHAEE